ncbi:MAG TPA: DUF4321 domain-containing protein [Firmicutes bacterium]|nr:DUF4321 domain-containing protein [Bacillota bacterium]
MTQEGDILVKKDAGMVVIFLIVGAVFGGLLGELLNSFQALAGLAPYLVKTFTILDIPPVTINLYIVQFVVGLSLHPNIISIVGAILAVFLLRRF